MKVLIVKTSALGDIIHALPVLAHLKSADPAVEIDWLVEQPFAALLEGHCLIRRIHTINTKLWRKPGAFFTALTDVRNVLNRLRREKYDAALDLQGNSKSGIFTFLSRAPLRYGFGAKAVREWTNLLATNVRAPLMDADHHITDRYLRVASRAFPNGSGYPLTGPLHADSRALRQVRAQMAAKGLAGRKLVVIHYGTTWKTKRMSIELWRNLAAGMTADRDIHLLLTWGNEEELAAARAIHGSVSERATICPRMSLKELAALLSSVDLVVGGDTGPVHIAAALGVPTVSLFRATDALRNGPRGELHVHFQSPMDCSPCLLKDCPADGKCAQGIEAAQVLQAVEGLLRKRDSHGAGGGSLPPAGAVQWNA